MKNSKDPKGGCNTMSARGIDNVQPSAEAQFDAEITQSVLNQITAVPTSNNTDEGAALSYSTMQNDNAAERMRMLEEDVYGEPDNETMKNAEVTEEQQKLLEYIQYSEIDPTEPIEPDEFLFQWGGIDFAPRQNLISLKAQSKAGKTFILTAICGAFLSGNNGGLLSYAQPNERVLFVDTEQSRNDTRKILQRLTNELPNAAERFKILNLRNVDPHYRVAVIQAKVEQYKPSLIVVDGIADLIPGMEYNETAEADSKITELSRIAEQYNAVVFTAIHVNKNDDTATGWLGRLLLQKCAVELMVEKDKTTGQRLLKPTAVRHTEFPSISFEIVNTEDGLGKARIIPLDEAHDRAESKERDNYRSKLESWGINPPLTLKRESFTTHVREKRTEADGKEYSSSAASNFVSRCIGCGLFKFEGGFVTFES